MTLPKVPGALVLGLLASLAAHAVIFGSSHAMGGPYDGLLLQSALGGLIGLIALFGALAWGDGGGTSDGTVLAARLRHRLPDEAAVLLSAGLWFAIAESVERGHAAAPIAGSLAALIAASYAVAWIARAIIGVVARAVLAVMRTAFSPRTPSWRRRAHRAVAPAGFFSLVAASRGLLRSRPCNARKRDLAARTRKSEVTVCHVSSRRSSPHSIFHYSSLR